MWQWPTIVWWCWCLFYLHLYVTRLEVLGSAFLWGVHACRCMWGRNPFIAIECARFCLPYQGTGFCDRGSLYTRIGSTGDKAVKRVRMITWEACRVASLCVPHKGCAWVTNVSSIWTSVGRVCAFYQSRCKEEDNGDDFCKLETCSERYSNLKSTGCVGGWLRKQREA